MGDEEMGREKKYKNKEGKKQFIIMALIFIAGLSIFLYPVISSYINSKSQSYVIDNYKEETIRMDKEEKEKLRKEALEYNRKLRGGAVITDPFSENIPQQTGVSYMDLMSIKEVMGYLEIPKIKLNLPIYHGTSDDVLQSGIGHIEQTSLPIGGESTNSVLTGHRGLPEATMFRNLNKMALGDVFYIHSLDEILAYKVFDIEIVIPTNIEKLRIEEGHDIVTLITCDPYMINTNRLLVRGERIDYTPPVEIVKEDDEPTVNTPSEPKPIVIETTEKTDRSVLYMGTTAGVLLAAGLMILLLKRSKKRKVTKDET